MKPSVGRIVHYYPSSGELEPARPRAAIVTRVWTDDVVDLEVCGADAWVGEIGQSYGDALYEWRDGDPSTGVFGLPTSVRFGGPDVPGSWCWPPRVE